MADEKDTTTDGENEEEQGSSTDDQGDDGAGNDGGAADDADENDGDDDDQDDDDDADEEPPVRNNASFIIARKDAKIAKLQKQVNEKNNTGGKATDGDDDDEAGGDADPDDDKVRSAVDEAIKPFREKQEREEIDKEVNAFVADNPDFKPFAEKAKKWAAHPTRKNLPIKTIMYEVAGDKLLAIGAKRSKAADNAARQTQSGGNSSRGDGDGKKGVWEMTDKEFEDRVSQVKYGKK